MDRVMLSLEERKAIGGGRVKRLRKTGYIPAVIYGQGAESVATQVKASDFREFLSRNGRNAVFTTEFAAEQDFSMLVKDIQYNAFRNDIVHVDFQRVSLDENIRTEVPVRVFDGDKINKADSVIVHQLNSVTVECLPQDVPPYIVADVSGMTPGHSLTAAQLKLPFGISLITNPNDVILSVTGSNLELKVNKNDEPVVPEGEEGDVHAKRVK